jgi:hypothetical protein
MIFLSVFEEANFVKTEITADCYIMSLVAGIRIITYICVLSNKISIPGEVVITFIRTIP